MDVGTFMLIYIVACMLLTNRVSESWFGSIGFGLLCGLAFPGALLIYSCATTQ